MIDIKWFWETSLLACAISTIYATSASATIDVKVEGCFRQEGSNNVTCRLIIKNPSHVSAKTAFNTSNNRRVSGLDKYCSWVWDNFGQQYQIVEARVGIGRSDRWRVPFEVPGGLQIPGEITVSDVSPSAKSFSRMSLNFSPGSPVWKEIETFEFKKISID